MTVALCTASDSWPSSVAVATHLHQPFASAWSRAQNCERLCGHDGMDPTSSPAAPKQSPTAVSSRSVKRIIVSHFVSIQCSTSLQRCQIVLRPAPNKYFPSRERSIHGSSLKHAGENQSQAPCKKQNVANVPKCHWPSLLSSRPPPRPRLCVVCRVCNLDPTMLENMNQSPCQDTKQSLRVRNTPVF